MNIDDGWSDGRAPRHFTVVDVETTGLDPANHRVIQLAAVRIDWDGQVIDSFDTVVRPESPEEYEHGAEQIHGISAEVVSRGMALREALKRLHETVVGSVVVGHNIRFDLGFLAAEADRVGLSLALEPHLDTLRLARRLDVERGRSHRLGDLCERYGIDIERAHDALADATATARLLLKLLPEHGITEPGQLEHLLVKTRG